MLLPHPFTVKLVVNEKGGSQPGDPRPTLSDFPRPATSSRAAGNFRGRYIHYQISIRDRGSRLQGVRFMSLRSDCELHIHDFWA